jgi:hypothetical protein
MHCSKSLWVDTCWQDGRKTSLFHHTMSLTRFIMMSAQVSAEPLVDSSLMGPGPALSHELRHQAEFMVKPSTCVSSTPPSPRLYTWPFLFFLLFHHGLSCSLCSSPFWCEARRSEVCLRYRRIESFSVSLEQCLFMFSLPLRLREPSEGSS